jgi:hypothetical protein
MVPDIVYEIQMICLKGNSSYWTETQGELKLLTRNPRGTQVIDQKPNEGCTDMHFELWTFADMHMGKT